MQSAIERLQIDTRAQREVQRLSGGNQQKVTIARWIAADARTILCFDPTRGIDVRTKQEIYKLLRQLADQGKSILFYTSELEEIQLVCDRAIVIFGGRVVDILPVEIADEPALTRAAYGLPRDAKADVGILADAASRWPRRDPLPPPERLGRRACSSCSSSCSSSPRSIQPSYGAGDFGSLVRAVLPYAFAVAAQTVVVIAGGIDLSVASMMALTSVTAASMMDGASEEYALFVVPFVLAMGFVLGARQRHPDRRDARARHRGDAGDAVRAAGRGAARARTRPGGGVGRMAEEPDRRHGPDPRHSRQQSRLDPEGAGASDRAALRRLDTAHAIAARPVDLRHRLQPACGVPQRRAGRAHQDHRLCARRPVRARWAACR